MTTPRASDHGAAKHALNEQFAHLGRALANTHRVEIVAYCRGPYCALAPAGVALLCEMGRQARRLEDGFPEWRMAGLPVEVGPQPS